MSRFVPISNVIEIEKRPSFVEFDLFDARIDRVTLTCFGPAVLNAYLQPP